LDFENGASATAIYNGYGGMSSMDLTQNISEWGYRQTADSRQWYTAHSTPQSAEQELAAKQKRALNAIPSTAQYQPHFGLTVVSGSQGDIRQTPQGLMVCNASGNTEIHLPTHQSPRDLVLAELEQTWRGKGSHWHSGHWGLENLRICEAAIASAASGREVLLST
jgi:phthalate 4,5-cis-dihydrodiol dehydrogenase